MNAKRTGLANKAVKLQPGTWKTDTRRIKISVRVIGTYFDVVQWTRVVSRGFNGLSKSIIITIR